LKKRRSRPPKPGRESIRLRALGTDRFELVHPPCARERADDVAEVHEMLAAGEADVARDELRWLLEGCSDFLEAHVLLGRLAWDEGRVDLARGHYGYAHAIGRRALGPRFRGSLPYEQPANRPLIEAAVGLARCLAHLARHDDARRVLEEVLLWDAGDPLGARAILDELDRKKESKGHSATS
jgi:hypothetical protein